jgi:hypothetical protein
MKRSSLVTKRVQFSLSRKYRQSSLWCYILRLVKTLPDYTVVVVETNTLAYCTVADLVQKIQCLAQFLCVGIQKTFTNIL